MIQSHAPVLPTPTATHTAYLLPLVLLILGNSASRADAAFDNPSVCKNPSMFTPDKKVEAFSGKTCKAYMDTYFMNWQGTKNLNASVCASSVGLTQSSYLALFGVLCCSDTQYACNPLPTSAICAKPSDFNSSSLSCAKGAYQMKDVTEFSSSTCRRTGSDTPMAMLVDAYLGAACCGGAKTACTVAKEASPLFDNPSVCKNPSMFTPDKKLEVFSGRTCKAYMDAYFESSQFSFKKLNAEVCASMKDSSTSTFAQFGGLCCSDTHYACNPLPTSAICAKPSDFNSSSLSCSVYLTSSMKDVTEFSSSTCTQTSSDTPMAMQMDHYYGAACCSGAKSACDVANNQDVNDVANNQDVNGNSRLRIHELIRLSLVVAFFATKF